MAYVGFTATIGAVAVTTANDQMDRVTWATGTPLRDRWTREEERMLIDRVAGAWGFQQRWRRGEEEGQDWEALREWIGMRGMALQFTVRCSAISQRSKDEGFRKTPEVQFRIKDRIKSFRRLDVDHGRQMKRPTF
ncbi:MAG: hypothetical protein Q9177_006844 [Variospora cf. flavescens]